MAIQTFEYCSLQYLNQWLSHDKGFCDAFSGNDQINKLVALKSAGAFYGIARNLPTKFDQKKGIERYRPVLDILDKLEKSKFEENPVGEIEKVERDISKKYGNRGVLSLTTKFLWLKIKQPILIYDSQARIALGTEDGKLQPYYERWRQEFRRSQDEIKKVCSKLSNLNLYVADQEVGKKDYITKVACKEWFQERVFDIYLWNKGNVT